MKKISLIIVSLLFPFILTAQSGGSVEINRSFVSPDTLRTFSIWKGNLDDIRGNFARMLGKPQVNDAGRMEWKGLNIQDIGKDVTIQITDGILTLNRKSTSYVPFTNAVEKESLLKTLRKKQCRQLNIEFLDKAGANFVKTKKMEETIVKFLEVVTKEEK